MKTALEMTATEAKAISSDPDVSYFLKIISMYSKTGSTEMECPCISQAQIEKLKTMGYKFRFDKYTGAFKMSWGDSFYCEKKSFLKRRFWNMIFFL